MPKIQRAILSCHDRSGIVEFAEALKQLGVDIFSTEGTRHVLGEGGIEAGSIADLTGSREMLSGRVKTLHPRVHAGLLGLRGNKIHEEEMQTYQCDWIDLVVVNPRPLNEVIAGGASTQEEIVDQIDIGGIAMIRSAAKNFRYVSVVVNPERYVTLIHELRAHDGELPFPTRFRLAQEAFSLTAEYDRVLSEYFRSWEPPEE